ncbi:Transient receptor putative cation channel sub V member 3 [Chytriomyces hyalinus]|nr:Transient receptor putative cation channel sub V member 3 [Chytriomyces hyalinus]
MSTPHVHAPPRHSPLPPNRQPVPRSSTGVDIRQVFVQGHDAAPTIHLHQAQSEHLNNFAKAKERSLAQKVLANVAGAVRCIRTGGQVWDKPLKMERMLDSAGDLMEEHLQQSHCSIWSILLADKEPLPLEFQNYYYRHRQEFLNKHGYNMLLERGSNGESILCYSILFRKTELVRWMLGCWEYADLPATWAKGGEPTVLLKFPLLPQIINMSYQNNQFYGETAAHIVSVIFKDTAENLDKWRKQMKDIEDFPQLVHKRTERIAELQTLVATGRATEKDHSELGSLRKTKPNLKALRYEMEKSSLFWMTRLIANGADVHIPRANGVFFTQDELYLGETVLSFAACSGNKILVQYLIDNIRVDPSTTDSHGNNVLHVLCWWGYAQDNKQVTFSESVALAEPEKDDDDMISIIPSESIFAFLCNQRSRYDNLDLNDSQDMTRYQRTTDDLKRNEDGDTPLLVAVRRGHTKMVNALLDYKRDILWTFGPIEMAKYSVMELDTYLDAEVMSHKTGALTIAVKEGHIPILKLPIFSKLLESKWARYAKRRFWTSFIFHLVHMLISVFAIGLIPNTQAYYDNPFNVTDTYEPFASRMPSFPSNGINTGEDRRNMWRIILEVVMVIINVNLFINVFVDVAAVAEAGIVDGMTNLLRGFSGVEKSTQLVHVGVFAAGVGCRIANAWQAENILWGLYSLIGWGQVFFFTRGFERLGPLGMVLFNVVKRDVPRFLTLSSVFILAFGEAFWLQMGPFGHVRYEANFVPDGTLPPNGGEAGLSEWKELPGALLWTIRGFIIPGTAPPYDDFRNANIAWIAQTLLFIFYFFANILLINVFIAMVGATFNQVQDRASDEWLLSRAHLIMQYDQRILSKHYMQAFWRKIAGSEYPSDAAEYKAMKRKLGSIEMQLAKNRKDGPVAERLRLEKEKKKYEARLLRVTPETRIGVERFSAGKLFEPKETANASRKGTGLARRSTLATRAATVRAAPVSVEAAPNAGPDAGTNLAWSYYEIWLESERREGKVRVRRVIASNAESKPYYNDRRVKDKARRNLRARNRRVKELLL